MAPYPSGMPETLGWVDVAASFVLVALVVVISRWRQLGLERDVIVASVRAAVQLLGVGLLFSAIFSSSNAMVWAWVWVCVMVFVAGWIVTRRASQVPALWLPATGAIALTAAIVLGVIFGLGILELTPVAAVVLAGITIGNTMPSVVLGANRMLETLRSERGQLEAMLALGADRASATRHFEQTVITSALIPQIERTKVVGLIALPGAMTGLLLAGVDPVDAIVIQLAVMFLVLGSVATSVVVVTSTIARRALTDDLRVAPWISQPQSA